MLRASLPCTCRRPNGKGRGSGATARRKEEAAYSGIEVAGTSAQPTGSGDEIFVKTVVGETLPLDVEAEDLMEMEAACLRPDGAEFEVKIFGVGEASVLGSGDRTAKLAELTAKNNFEEFSVADVVAAVGTVVGVVGWGGFGLELDGLCDAEFAQHLNLEAGEDDDEEHDVAVEDLDVEQGLISTSWRPSGSRRRPRRAGAATRRMVSWWAGG